jgi:hypothetical protein
VVDAQKKRVAVAVMVTAKDDSRIKFEGRSRGETADTNDFLTFELLPGREYLVKAAGMEKPIKAGAAGHSQMIEIVVGEN